MKRISVLMILTINFSCVFKGTTQSTNFDFQKFVDYLSTNDAHSRAMGYNYFNFAAPDAEKDQILKRAWDLSNIQVQKSILSYFITYPEKKDLWSEGMENNIISLAKHEDPQVRKLCLNALTSRQDSSLNNLVLTFLEDEDEIVRETAIVEISKWSNAKIIFQNYLIKNEKNEKLQNTLEKMRFFMRKTNKN